MYCQLCNESTTNPKFCSKSCAASYNNKSPKRVRTNSCKDCQRPCLTSRTYCSECWTQKVEEREIKKASETLGSMRGGGNANRGGRYPLIRQWARKAYLKSDKPQYCVICGHPNFDVAHIKDISRYDETVLISVINDLNNLVALCKTHHGDFDNGDIGIEWVEGNTFKHYFKKPRQIPPLYPLSYEGIG